MRRPPVPGDGGAEGRHHRVAEARYEGSAGHSPGHPESSGLVHERFNFELSVRNLPFDKSSNLAIEAPIRTFLGNVIFLWTI